MSGILPHHFTTKSLKDQSGILEDEHQIILQAIIPA